MTKDTIYVINNNDIDKTRQFIEDNFLNSNEIPTNIVNFKKLITFLDENNINLNYYDLRSLIESSYKLENTINVIKRRKIFNKIFETTTIGNIQNIYINLVNIIDENSEKKSKKYKSSDFKEFNDYQKEIFSSKKLTIEEQNELLKSIKAGDNLAKEKLIVSYLPLVLGTAKKFAYAWNYEDLVQLGTIGLIKGINSYDYEKGKNFLSYITLCIERNMYSNIYSDIKLDYFNYNRIREMIQLMIEYYFKYDKVLSDEEIAEIQKCKIETIKKYKKIINFKVLEKDSSFDRLNLEDELIDYTEEDKILEKEYLNELKKLCDSVSLSPREKEVINLLYYECIKNHSQVANMIGLSRERVRQIKLKALRKFQFNFELRKYIEFNNDFDEYFDYEDEEYFDNEDEKPYKKRRKKVNLE